MEVQLGFMGVQLGSKVTGAGLPTGGGSCRQQREAVAALS
jgi:hypothetical protein